MDIENTIKISSKSLQRWVKGVKASPLGKILDLGARILLIKTSWMRTVMFRVMVRMLSSVMRTVVQIGRMQKKTGK